MKVKVSVTGLKKSFGENEVLKGIDIEIREGEVVCVIGLRQIYVPSLFK